MEQLGLVLPLQRLHGRVDWVDVADAQAQVVRGPATEQHHREEMDFTELFGD